MMGIFLLLFLYAICALATAGVARWISRPLPTPLLFGFAAAPILFFSPGLLAGKTPLPMGRFQVPPWGSTAYAGHYNPYLDDVVQQFLPWADAVRLAWSEGELPLRNRWNGCGSALSANGSSAAFSPLTLLALPLHPVQSLLLIAAVKILLALTGTWLWLKELRLRHGPALFGAVAFAFSFSMTPWIFFPQTAVLGLWPWALFALEALPDPAIGRRAFWLLTGVFAFWPLAGHIESVALGAAFIGIWLLGRMIARDLPEPARTTRRVALAASVALGLSAFFLLPHAVAIAASNRRALVENPFWTSLVDWSPHGPAWPNGLITTLFPRALGDGIASPVLPGTAVGSFPEMGLGFFGITGWAAAFLVFRPGRGRRCTALPLWLALVFGLGAAILLWPFGEIVRVVPGLQFLFPLRFLSWVALAGAAIAAFELDRLEGDLQNGRRGALLAPIVTAAALVFCALLVFVRFQSAHASSGGLVSQKRALVITVGALGLFAALPAVIRRVRATGSRWTPCLAVALALLCAGELFYQGRRLYRFHSFEAMPADSSLLAYLRSRAGPFRVLGDEYLLYPSTNILARLEDVRTHDPVERREYVEMLDAAAGYAPAEYFKQLRDVNAPILDFLNVRYFVGRPGRQAPGPKWRTVYAGTEGTVFENDEVMPRVFAPPRIRFARKAVPFPPTSDWHQEAVVEDSASFSGGGRANGGAQVRGYRESANSVSFVATVSVGSAWLVTSLVQDGGWSARSPAGPVRTARANGPFLALELPSGNQLVNLRYRPPGLMIGAWITAATVALLAAVGLGRARRRRARP